MSLALNGIDEYVQVPHHPQLKPQLPLSVSAWINLHQSEQNGMIIQSDQYNGAHSGFYFRLAYDGSRRLALGYNDGGSDSWTAIRKKVGTTILQPGRWYHVAGVIRGPQDMSIYVNGIRDGGEYGGAGSGVLHYTEEDIMIGSQMVSIRSSLVSLTMSVSTITPLRQPSCKNCIKPVFPMAAESEGTGKCYYQSMYYSNTIIPVTNGGGIFSMNGF
jgi:hypothetical protein